MSKCRIAHRQPIQVRRNCSMGVISFKELAWSHHVVRLTDLSRDGVGIEAEAPITPGFVWFGDRVGGYKGGVLIWSKQQGGQYRGGIRFVPLTPDEERFVEEPAVHPPAPHQPRRSPEEIIDVLVRSMTKGGSGSS